MSDDRLRELERRWEESGAPADEAAWLRERERQGLAPLASVFALILRFVDCPLPAWAVWRVWPDTSACDPSWEALERRLVLAGEVGPVLLDLTAFDPGRSKLFSADTFASNGPRSSIMRRVLDIQDRNGLRVVMVERADANLFPADWGASLTRVPSVDDALCVIGWESREWRRVPIKVDVPSPGYEDPLPPVV